MKKIALIVLSIAIVACQKQEKGYSISGTASGFDNGTSVYINVINDSNRPTIIDSTTIIDGKFSIQLPETATLDFNYLTFKDTPGNVLFLPENNPIKMTIYKDSLRSSVVKGGDENNIFFTYIDKVNSLGEKKAALRSKFQASGSMGQSDKALQLVNEQKAITTEENDFRRKLAQDHPSSIVSVMALSDLMSMKVMSAKEAKKIFAGVTDTLKTTRLGKNLNRLIEASIGKMDIGSEAENFTAPTPDGDMLSLKDAMGKITIIDFWASWCKPCRLENPNVVRIYNKYHDKGLNIVGVSLDRKKEQWIQAIDQDNLQWSHVSNLQFWQDPVAKAYGIRSIPETFIVDENGIIIAKNLRGSELEKKIAELLGNNNKVL